MKLGGVFQCFRITEKGVERWDFREIGEELDQPVIGGDDVIGQNRDAKIFYSRVFDGNHIVDL